MASRLACSAVKAPDAHLRRADPVMAGLIDDFGGALPVEPDGRGRPEERYAALVRSITGQQLSVKAAASIWGRLLERFGGRTPTPEQILADDPEELRMACGFSRAKVVYLRSLAEHVLAGEIELDRLDDLPDGEVIRELTAVKGIGEWTAHMFLMFTLHRPDVLPTGDLGVRNAAMRAYGLDAPPAPADLEALAEPWRPHRTRACLYLWRSLDNEPLSSAP
jgi:DNA-3-methyladenine glycosylase II